MWLQQISSLAILGGNKLNLDSVFIEWFSDNDSTILRVNKLSLNNLKVYFVFVERYTDNGSTIVGMLKS